MVLNDACSFSTLIWFFIRQKRDECLESVFQAAISLAQIHIRICEWGLQCTIRSSDQVLNWECRCCPQDCHWARKGVGSKRVKPENDKYLSLRIEVLDHMRCLSKQMFRNQDSNWLESWLLIYNIPKEVGVYIPNGEIINSKEALQNCLLIFC